MNGFGLEQKNIGITILQGDPTNDRWWFCLKCDMQKQHTPPKKLMAGPSAARACFESGDSLFIPDIRKGVQEGMFFESERSKSSGIGSVFCKPVRITVGRIEYYYIFTIAVYGQTLCTPYDPDDCTACERILDELADRIELELYLYSIRKYKDSGGNSS
jgi:hypothetical protein